MLSNDEGKFLINLARKSIETYIKEKKIIPVPDNTPPSLKENRGAFVTLNKSDELRGCIGYPEPIKPLVNAVIEVAVSAATTDPRFEPVSLSELDEIQLEVSVLTKPQLVKVKNPAEYLEKIEIGEDGLIIEKGFYKGLLLPQVAVEWRWDSEEFLCNTCMKAGLSPDCWYESDTEVYIFQDQIFHEE
jgi:uncharacterized protein (TIGR00296 family)